MRLSWFIAKRIGSEKTQMGGVGNAIAIISVAVSIIVIILSLCISNGFRKEIREKAVTFYGDASINPFGERENEQSNKIDSLRALRNILQLPYVESASGISYRPGMIKTDEAIQGIVLQGVDSSFEWCGFRNSLLIGTLPHPDSLNPLLISKRLAQKLELECGDGVLLYFVGSEGVKLRKFRVCGIHTLQLEKFDQTYIYTNKSVVNSLNGWESGASSKYIINYTSHDDKLAESRKRELVESIYSNMSEEDGMLYVTTINEDMSQLFDWLNLLDTNVLIILIIMIVVAGFNMISALLIILFENISKIGILKTLGMQNNGIKKIFLAKSSKIILWGIIIGDFIALAIATLQKYYKIFKLDPDNYFIDAVPIDLTLWHIVATDIVCFVAIMAVLLIPCHLISKIEPAKTIKLR